MTVSHSPPLGSLSLAQSADSIPCQFVEVWLQRGQGNGSCYVPETATVRFLEDTILSMASILREKKKGMVLYLVKSGGERDGPWINKSSRDARALRTGDVDLEDEHTTTQTKLDPSRRVSEYFDESAKAEDIYHVLVKFPQGTFYWPRLRTPVDVRIYLEMCTAVRLVEIRQYRNDTILGMSKVVFALAYLVPEAAILRIVKYVGQALILVLVVFGPIYPFALKFFGRVSRFLSFSPF